MKDWYHRLAEVRKKRGLSQGKFAREIKADVTTISRYESGRGSKTPTDAFILKLEKLLTESEIAYIKGEQSTDMVAEPAIEYGGGTVPVLGVKVSAGGGNHIESIDSYETRGVLRVDERMFPGGIEGVRALEVEGESMIPMVMPGSWVFCRPVSEWGGDALYVLIFRGILMVKLVTADPATGHLWIRSANPAYESWEYDPTEDQSTMRIMGRVVRVLW